MAYNLELDSRITQAISSWNTVPKKMFGGICHLYHGNMLCGVYKDDLILRLGEEAGARALQEAHVKPFDITGRAMKGWVMVEAPAFQGDDLQRWLELARAFVGTLEPK
jgi:hypothetical protein